MAGTGEAGSGQWKGHDDRGSVLLGSNESEAAGVHLSAEPAPELVLIKEPGKGISRC